MKTVTIGRAQDNKVVFSSPTVSSHHANLSVDESGNVLLSDFSKNGTQVNGKLLNNALCRLHHGDIVLLPGGNKLDWEVYVHKLEGHNETQYGSFDPIYGTQYGNPFSVVSPSIAVPMEMNFFDAIKSVLSKYASFSGRARRKEFWYFYLANTLILSFISILAFINLDAYFYCSGFYGLCIFLPNLCLTVRRLHDTEHSGLFLFLIPIPLVGFILLLIWFCTEGTNGSNKYGADPKFQ